MNAFTGDVRHALSADTNRRAAAARRLAQRLDHAEAEILKILDWALRVLTWKYTYAEVVRKLTEVADRAPDEAMRGVVLACMPPTEEAYLSGRAAAAADAENATRVETVREERIKARQPRKVAARNTHRRVDQNRRLTAEQRAERRTDNEIPAPVLAYQETRAGVDDEPEQEETPDGYTLDYDLAAVPAVRGRVCISCRIERAAGEVWTKRYRAGHGDDGLCENCRESGRPGIPELPTGHDYAAAVVKRCKTVTATLSDTEKKLTILRQEYRQGNQRDKLIIKAFVAAHLTPAAQEDTENPQETNAVAA